MTISEAFDYEEPCFVISVAARMVGVPDPDAPLL